jgi:hypothetical protein
VKAASGSGVSYFLGQVLDDVLVLERKTIRGGRKEGIGQLTPDRVRICYYREAAMAGDVVDSDGEDGSDEGSGGSSSQHSGISDSGGGGVTFVFHQTDHVSPEAIHDRQVKYYNPLHGGALILSTDKVVMLAKASPASILRQFTISVEESERLNDVISGKAGKAVLREQCQKAFGIVSIGDDNDDDDEEDDFVEEDDDNVLAQYKVGEKLSRQGRKRDVIDFKRMSQGKASTVPKQVKTACAVCQTNNRKSAIIYCDHCEKEYHLHCLAPALLAVPDGDWFGPCCPLKAS